MTLLRERAAPWLTVGVAATYLVGHLPSLAPSLEDSDSINFALGLREFDVARHQPHPPGYPIYTALGRLSLAVVETFSSSLELHQAEALALAWWSALAGAIAIVAAAALFRTLRASAPGSFGAAPWLAAILLAVTPLFWMCGLRPMSDMVGLAAALLTQAVILRAIAAEGERANRLLVVGAVAAGLAAGIRIQNLWLTLPLLALAIVERRGAAFRGHCVRAVLGVAAAIAVWLAPLLVASGGPGAYLRALSSQVQDSARVDGLWVNPTARQLAFALYETFVLPWGSLPLGVAILIAAAAGVLMMLARERRSLMLLTVAFAPYAAFHLFVQETVTVRYALPLVVPVGWLAVRAIAVAGPLAPPITLAVGLWAAVVAIPAGVVYGREPHPAFRALEDMRVTAEEAPPAEIHSHYSLRRVLEASRDSILPIVASPRDYEWMGLVDYWRTGGTAPIWFLADPRRTDLDLIERQSRRDVVSYDWISSARPELSGTRPLGALWYRFGLPGWFAADGWSLTPETGGLTRARGRGLDRRPIEAYVRRRPEPMRAMVGGRDLGASSDTAVEFTLSLDGATVDSWMFDHRSAGPNFLRFIELPLGIPPGDGEYAHLTIAARAVGGGDSIPEVAIRQFDVQPASGVMYGFGEGWHEEEYDPATGRRWRWTSNRSVLRIFSSRPVDIRLRGESPLKYFDDPPVVRVTASGETIATLRPSADFEWRMTVPAAAIARAQGAIVLEMDRVYLPGQAEGTTDERQLGLRLFEIDVVPSTLD